jgi:hypothetical protein
MVADMHELQRSLGQRWCCLPGCIGATKLKDSLQNFFWGLVDWHKEILQSCNLHFHWGTLLGKLGGQLRDFIFDCLQFRLLQSQFPFDSLRVTVIHCSVTSVQLCEHDT